MNNHVRRLSVILALVLLAACFPTWTLAAPNYKEYDIYVERPAETAGNRFYHGAKYEPKTGSYLALFAEGDEAMHDPNAPSVNEWYFGKVPEVTGKDHAVYMLYILYKLEGVDVISHYATHFQAAKEQGKAMQLCIETRTGLDEVQDDAYLADLAMQARDAEIPIFLRFDSEFNLEDGSNTWQGDPEKYIEKFRIVANAFHKYAPNVAMVWGPNDWPIGSEDAFYPGDEYVDWIGVSSYPIFLEDGSPKHDNTWIDRFYLLYENYGSKKPIFITEGAPSPTVEYHKEIDVTDQAQYEIRRFYAGVARRCPNLKMIVYWSNNEGWGREIQCALGSNQRMLSAYRSAIADDYFIGTFNASSKIWYQRAAEATLEGTEKLSCYVNDAENRVATAYYYVNDKYFGQGNFPDYTLEANLSAYSGRNITLRADFYTESGQYVSSASVETQVGGKSADSVGGFVDVTPGAFYTDAVAWAVKKGITTGTSKTTFSPGDDCTRSQIVTFLWRAKGSPAPNAAECPFTDVNPAAYYYKAMMWAVETGVTAGLDATHFGPDEPCTRAQAVTFLWRAEGKPEPKSMTTAFTDVKESGFYYKAMLWAGEQNITKGATAATFEPETNCNRGHIVTFLYRDLG